MSEIVVVLNTGPLVSAFRCGRFDLLRRYFAAIHFTQAGFVRLSGLRWPLETVFEE